MFAAEAYAKTRQKIRTVPYGKLIHKHDISASLRVSNVFFQWSSIERSQITFLLCTISYSVSLGFLVEQPQSYQGTNKTCFINSCHVFSSVFRVINELECVFWSTVRFLLTQSKLNCRRCWRHYIVLWFPMSLKVKKQDFI